MAVGDLINYANYKEMAGGSWRLTPSWEDTDKTVYLASCCFVVRIRCTSVLWRTSKMTLNAYYYNGSSWVRAYENTISQKNAGTTSQFYYHNRADEGTTSTDQHQHHLWKFVISNTIHPGSSHTYFELWAGGMETMNETEYNSYFKGQKLMGINCSYSDSSSDTDWVNNKYPSVYKGTPIGVSSGTYKYLCYEKGYID